MADIFNLILNLFKNAHPAVQLCFLVVCLGSSLLFVFLFVRDRSRLHDFQRRCDEYRDQLKQFHAQRVAEQATAEEGRERLRADLHRSRAEEERSRWQLQRALPSFTRVVQQNDELGRLLQQAEAHHRQDQSKLLDYEKVLEERDELNEIVEAVRTQEARLKGELEDLRQRFIDLEKIDTDVWIAPPKGSESTVAFVPQTRRTTRFVTFLNLKGGVGKTTLTANLAAAYATGVANEKLRVLAIDLDYQGTLSNLCVERQFLLSQRSNHRTADRLIANERADDPIALVRELLAPMKSVDQAQVIVADEHLDQIDFRKQAIYTIERSEVRFCHRKLLHQAIIFDQFDFVFFDCPPRLSTSTINALVASDWIVVPTALDPNDVEAVPRTLRWLEKLQKQSQLDFHAKLGGVILNSTYRKGTIDDLTQYEAQSLKQLEAAVKQFTTAGEPILNHVIKNDSDVPRWAAGATIFGAAEDGHALYGDLARELYERIKH